MTTNTILYLAVCDREGITTLLADAGVGPEKLAAALAAAQRGQPQEFTTEVRSMSCELTDRYIYRLVQNQPGWWVLTMVVHEVLDRDETSAWIVFDARETP